MKGKTPMKTLALSIAALALLATSAHAQGCTRNHELSRIVPEYRTIMLDGNDIKRVMYVDWKDERLTTWKPGHNITYCPDENKVINTTINSVATLIFEFLASCNTRIISDEVHGALRRTWEYTNQHLGGELSLITARGRLGWFYKVCTDHEPVDKNWDNGDFKEFLIVAESLTSIDMAVEDPANESIYKARAAQYRQWADALYEAERKKGLVQRIWERFTASNSR
jgi:hypothetical protein